MKDKNLKPQDVLLVILAVLLLAFILLQYVFHVDLIMKLVEWLKARGIARPELSSTASLGLVFLYGLMSSVHCVGMCGGIVLSLSSNPEAKSVTLQNVKYQAARILSYSLVGLLLGALGTVLSIPKHIQGYVPIVCGVIMLIYGISILFGRSAFPLPKWYSRTIGRMVSANAFVLGALTALLPCGTMQAVQFYAIASASPVKGMLAMLVFALGTVPLLFLFGAMSSVFENKNLKWILPLTGVVILVLAIQMMLKGAAMVAM